ncbi:MAG TPA: VOC family protein [Gemmatimonadaceae bacterium]|nr:VOC family protein [Gemmatimonadaceae bacterium]
MLKGLGRTTLLVHDYEEALAFYRDVLGFTVLHDSTASSGQRFLHIGLPDQRGSPPVGLWLLEPAGDDAELVGRQAGGQPLLVIYTDDCHGDVATLQRRGVGFRGPPVAEGGALFAHFSDLYGNVVVLVELLM